MVLNQIGSGVRAGLVPELQPLRDRARQRAVQEDELHADARRRLSGADAQFSVFGQAVASPAQQGFFLYNSNGGTAFNFSLEGGIR
jgi:hypothetical protein